MFILTHGLYNMLGEPESHYSLKTEAKQTRARHHTLSTPYLFHFPSLSAPLFSLIFSGYVTNV